MAIHNKDLNIKKFLDCFINQSCKKHRLQITFRTEKVVYWDKLYVKWKGYHHSFIILVHRKNIKYTDTWKTDAACLNKLSKLIDNSVVK